MTLREEILQRSGILTESDDLDVLMAKRAKFYAQKKAEWKAQAEKLNKTDEPKKEKKFDYYKPSLHANQLKSVYKAFMENKGTDFGKGINWAMEELFGANWKDNCGDAAKAFSDDNYSHGKYSSGKFCGNGFYRTKMNKEDKKNKISVIYRPKDFEEPEGDVAAE